ncbi:MAG: trimethylamine methyltransferase family protein, partial [Desulfohalobiaceae bacterium]|nr:trimethylamine methyltransferase family protein [Desulfohalobiaceae bacterium]
MDLNLIAEGRRPELSFLNRQDKEQIFAGALRILEEYGMEIMQPEAVELLQKAGCSRQEDNMITIPADLVRRAVSSAPSSFPVFDREGNPAMEVGGYRSYYGPGSDLMYTLDCETLERRESRLEDVKRAAEVCDKLANIDFIMSSAYPSEIPASQSYLYSFSAMVENSGKPIVCTAEGKRDLFAMWEIACVLRGNAENLAAEPYFVHYAEPISPRKHPVDSLEKLLFCAEKKIPCIYSPAPISGSTAPMTIAGHVVQGLAESFCGLVIHQLKNPGAPFLMGMGAAVLDMATSQCSYNAPEYYLAYMGMVEMSHFVDLPSWGYAGTSDSQIPDGQAVLESGFQTLLATLGGANLNHDVGYLNFGLTGCLEMIVITDEIIELAKRLKKGVPVNWGTLGLESIKEVGSQGHYLTQAHTLEHLRSTQWRPELISRDGFETWEKKGR